MIKLKEKKNNLWKNYIYGSLKMVDIKTQLKSFQINWVNRLINKEISLSMF